MPEHVDSADCGCWGCVSVGAEQMGVCVVHLFADPSRSTQFVAVDGQNMCALCEEQMRADLATIVNSWDEAQEALHPGQNGASERHAQRTEAPLPFNVSVSDALRVVRDNVWSVALGLVDDHEGLALPADQTTPSLAEWIGRWQVLRIAQSKNSRRALYAYWWLADAADLILTKTHGVTAQVALPDQWCKRPGCGGQLEVVQRADGSKIVQCQGSSRHSIPWDIWSQMLKASKPRGARPPRLGRV